MNHDRAGAASDLPGEPCRVAPHAGWSDLEAWVWQEVGSGRIADINQKLGRTANPKKPEDWGPERRLSPCFLETILLYDPWRSAIPRRGVHLEGAWFDQRIDLSHALIASVLWLEHSRLDADLRFVGSQFRTNFIIHESVVYGGVAMDSVKVVDSLLLRQNNFGYLDLKNEKHLQSVESSNEQI